MLEPVCKAICGGKRAFAWAASSKATVLITPVFACFSRLKACFQLYTQALRDNRLGEKGPRRRPPARYVLGLTPVGIELRT